MAHLQPQLPQPQVADQRRVTRGAACNTHSCSIMQLANGPALPCLGSDSLCLTLRIIDAICSGLELIESQNGGIESQSGGNTPAPLDSLQEHACSI